MLLLSRCVKRLLLKCCDANFWKKLLSFLSFFSLKSLLNCSGLMCPPLFAHLVTFLCSVELMPSKWGLVMDRLLVLSRRFSDILTKVQEFLWRLLELHILKMAAFFSVWVALEEVIYLSSSQSFFYSIFLTFFHSFLPSSFCPSFPPE